MHALFGNKKLGYRVAAWNCRRGLLNSNGSQSSKITDIKLYLQKHQLHMFGIIEADLHGPNSRIVRKNPLSTQDVHDKLHIDGYFILLPQSWYKYGQARVIVYIKEGIKPKIRILENGSADLPSVSVELGLSREKKTCFNIYYREFTGGISGKDDLRSQKDRLARQISHWKSLYAGGRDVVILGDSNLCAMQWEDDNYVHKEMAMMTQDFLLEQSSKQLVTSITRVELSGLSVQRSCIDHCYTDVREKVLGPYVEPVGDSDHLGVRVLKYSKTPIVKPQATRRRCYKNFSIEAFLSDIFHSNINASVTSHQTIEGAAEAFRNEFQAILNYHAPIRTIQVRKKYCPHLTEETKLLQQERNILQQEASRTGDSILMQEFKIKSKETKKAVEKDKREGQERELGEVASSSQAWKSARSILGIQKNLSPTSIKDKDGILVSNPSSLATMFNEFFLEKVRLLRAKTNTNPKVNPVTRLQSWLESSGKLPLPKFSIKPISREKLRKLIKRMKGGKSSGVDTIDSYSLKLAAPLIEDALEHLINLSITTAKFASLWKPQLIFPQHKKSEKDVIENYRPVSHLVEVGKLVEHEVNDQVTEHFLSNNLFHSNHHGGIANHSTNTALIQLNDMFLQAAVSKKFTGALLLDQSAAYDLLDHPILLKKLELYNFDENSIRWFKSYLSNRSQAVQVETKQSSLEDLDDHAAPQGSVLGGTLFIINENDFPACRVEGESVLFVDDDTDAVSEADPATLVAKLLQEAEHSCDWLQDNRMCVAGHKS